MNLEVQMILKLKEEKLRKKTKQSKLDRILEVPMEVSSQTPKITIQGFSKMLIENYKVILEYQDIYIRIKTYSGIINVTGFNLKLNDMTSDDIMIEGDIDSVDFEKIE